ncbi:MAG TPA: substrate-binding domain-containing protein [Accumulibacter sp.]|nr:substrate-binding domain-containing protein [Accumulibacter sp.]
MTLEKFGRMVFALLICLLPKIVCSQPATESLLIYCGITMVRPITEIARRFEQMHNVKITIAQGGSEDLFQSAKKSGIGDLYLPGKPDYRDRHLAEGLFDQQVLLGYNQMALVVARGNPRKVRADLSELLRKDLMVIIGSPENGSVGNETKLLLDKIGIYDQVVSRTVSMVPDSRALIQAMKRNEADVVVSWRATAFFPENSTALEAIDLDPKIATPHALLLIRLKLSKAPELARRFMDHAASPEGQAVFRKFGFLDSQMQSLR